MSSPIDSGISLPNQSVTENKSQHATTKRNLTLIDIVSQLRHYNASVKKGISSQPYLKLELNPVYRCAGGSARTDERTSCCGHQLLK